jgi:ElaB/YqjD/DUF883 family membrane-anchored ribosome-binding protein
MTKEELTQEPPQDVLHFDAHEFDGLREALDQEAKSLIQKGDQFIRDHPWVCMGVVALAGVAIGRVLCGRK